MLTVLAALAVSAVLLVDMRWKVRVTLGFQHMREEPGTMTLVSRHMYREPRIILLAPVQAMLSMAQ